MAIVEGTLPAEPATILPRVAWMLRAIARFASVFAIVVGTLVQHFGWDAAFTALGITSALAAIGAFFARPIAT